ncbi:MAG: hypothetical protein JWQ48_677 [Conexibacter sp.]|nr:hypothetical protein [Conexibacter sp.]
MLVAGGGVAALELLLGLRELAGMRIDLELLSPEADLRYPPLEVVEPFDLVPPSIALADALAPLGVVHHRDALMAVDVDGHTVQTYAGATLSYEALVVAVGARHEPPLPDTLTYADRASRAHFAVLLAEAEAESGRVRNILFAVPPGSTWRCRSTSSRS